MFSWLQSWNRSLSQWSGLVAKAPCPLCQRPTSQAVCLDCRRQVSHCQFSRPNWRNISPMPVLAWGRYHGALKQAIAALKYQNQPQLAIPLGCWMAEAWTQQGGNSHSAIVVPIPMHAAKQKDRGFNQAELLAQHFCTMTGLPMQSRGLVRIRETAAQFRLAGAARSQNLQDAFSLGKGFEKRRPNGPVLLLDDIFTTGATAQSAAQTLRSQGIRVQGIVVLAISEYLSEKQNYNGKG